MFYFLPFFTFVSKAEKVEQVPPRDNSDAFEVLKVDFKLFVEEVETMEEIEAF